MLLSAGSLPWSPPPHPGSVQQSHGGASPGGAPVKQQPWGGPRTGAWGMAGGYLTICFLSCPLNCSTSHLLGRFNYSLSLSLLCDLLLVCDLLLICDLLLVFLLFCSFLSSLSASGHGAWQGALPSSTRSLPRVRPTFPASPKPGYRSDPLPLGPV